MDKSDSPRQPFIHSYTEALDGRIIVKNGRVIYPVDLTGCLAELDVITEKRGIPRASAIREAIKSYADELRGLEVVSPRKVTERQARKEIQRFLRGKATVRTDEISDALHLDFDLVNGVLLKMWEEGRVEPQR